MIQTIIIYLFIIAIMSIGGSLKTTKKILGLSFPLFIALIFYSIIFGVRYGVGTDYFAYLEAYQHATIYGELTDNNEFLFDFLTLILAKNGFHFSIYFGIIAFFQIYFLAKTFSHNSNLLVCIMFSFMLTCSFLSWMNGLRQIMALSLFIFSVEYILKRDWKPYILIIVIASLFHLSALILLPLYFVTNAKKYIPSVRKQLILLLIALLFSGTYNSQVFNYLPSIIEDMGYAHYQTYINNPENLKLGVGYYIILILNVFILLYSRRMIIFINSRKFEFFYLLYFIGCIWNYLFLGSIPLNRPNYYFYGINFIIIGYYLWGYYRNRKFPAYRTQFIILVLLLILIFVGYLYSFEDNTMKYEFFWDALH